MPDEVQTRLNITTEYEGAVAIVTIERPPVNALNSMLVEKLETAFGALAVDTSIRCVVIRAEGRMFSAGADLGEIASGIGDPDGVDATVAYIARVQGLFTAVAELPVPTIAAVHGSAVGGGLELALACDIRIAGEGAMLGLPEARIGLVPAAGGTQRASRLLGPGAAARLVFEGELIDATEAYRIGLVQSVVRDGEVGMVVKQLASRISERPRATLVSAKRCLKAAGTTSGFDVELSSARELLQEPETVRLLSEF